MRVGNQPPEKSNATCRYGLQLAGVIQGAFLPLPNPALAGRTFAADRTGRLATPDSPALAGRAPEPHGSRVGTLRSPRQRPTRVVSFSSWLSDRSQVERYSPTAPAAIRNVCSQTDMHLFAQKRQGWRPALGALNSA